MKVKKYTNGIIDANLSNPNENLVCSAKGHGSGCGQSNEVHGFAVYAYGNGKGMGVGYSFYTEGEKSSRGGNNFE